METITLEPYNKEVNMSVNKIFKTDDPRIDFIMANYTKAMELEECLEHTKNNICIRLIKKLNKLLEEWGCDYCLEIGKNKSADYITWSETGYYDYEEAIGLYYSIEIENGWETLTGKGDYPVYLTLSADPAEGRRENSRKINAWIEKSHKIILANKNKLSSKGIRVVSGQEDWENYLVVIDLKELLLENLTTIKFSEIELRIKSKIQLLKEVVTGEKGLIKPFFNT